VSSSDFLPEEAKKAGFERKTSKKRPQTPSNPEKAKGTTEAPNPKTGRGKEAKGGGDFLYFSGRLWRDAGPVFLDRECDE